MRTAQKNHISGLLFSFLFMTLGFSFFTLNFVNRKVFIRFSIKLNKYRESFCCYVLIVLTTLKKVFSLSKLATNLCRCSARCIPMCSYCMYYCSLPSPQPSPLHPHYIKSLITTTLIPFIYDEVYSITLVRITLTAKHLN